MQNNVSKLPLSKPEELKNNGKRQRKKKQRAGLLFVWDRSDSFNGKERDRSISCKLQSKTKKHFNTSDSPTWTFSAANQVEYSVHGFLRRDAVYFGRYVATIGRGTIQQAGRVVGSIPDEIIVFFQLT
jgi:hypothetical protein